MVDSQWADFWWNSITGARMVVSSVTMALRDNKLVILDVPADLPWRHQMRSVIVNNLKKDVLSEVYVIHTIDAADECGDTEPGKYILNTYCTSREIKTGYRTKSKYSIQEYLISNNVLHNSIIWVKGLDDQHVKPWLKFCKEYNSPSLSDGLFVLELRGFSESVDSKKAEVISFSQLVSSYDVQLFNTFILDSKRRFSNDWKRYISTISASLCESDAEISAELLDRVDFTQACPLSGLQSIEKDYSSRGGDNSSKHVLAFFRKNDKQELEKRIWNTQVQILFPLIELERTRFITLYYSEIQDVLESRNIMQYEEQLTKPEDVEIGTLDYLVKTYKVNIPSADHRSRIDFLHYCRNEIAHMGCLNPEEVAKLLQCSFGK